MQRSTVGERVIAKASATIGKRSKDQSVKGLQTTVFQTIVSRHMEPRTTRTTPAVSPYRHPFNLFISDLEAYCLDNTNPPAPST